MSLQTRLEALVSAIGADVKSITTRINDGLIPSVFNKTSSGPPVTSITIVDDGTSTTGWPNKWEWLFKPAAAASGTLVSWFNEYGELRITPAKVNTVAFRIFGKTLVGDPAHSGNLFEIQDDRNSRNVMVGMDGAGNLVTAGAITRAVPGGPTLQTGYLVLSATALIPTGTPANTPIYRLT